MGRFEAADGRVYTGGWDRDRRWGFGSCAWPNGDSYVGEWRSNAMCVPQDKPPTNRSQSVSSCELL